MNPNQLRNKRIGLHGSSHIRNHYCAVKKLIDVMFSENGCQMAFLKKTVKCKKIH